VRLWSLHPRYLDPKGLVACWREALLAQAVLAGGTRGFRHHPQLLRFRQHQDPLGAIGWYLWHVAEEAERRGYRFARERILKVREVPAIPLPRGQLRYEWAHLLHKLQKRAPAWWERSAGLTDPEPHPLFFLVEGPIAPWERAAKSEKK